MDSAQCYELHFPHSVACLSVQLPRAWVGRWLTQVDSRAPRIVPRDRGWGQVLSTMGLQIGRDLALATAMPAGVLSDHLGALLSVILEPLPEPVGPALRGVHARSLALLHEQLAQPGLRAEAVARQAGVSPRTLHRSFAAQGTTFAGTLRRLRLEQAVCLLSQPRLAHIAVSELGRRCGFADASHFVREFQRAHGTTPARWRRARGCV